MQIWNIHSWSGSVRNKSVLSKFKEINFTVIILIGEVPGALSHALHIPSWDTECSSLMVAELNKIWQVIRQKTLKQVFLISWKSGNMLKLELGAGGLSFTMQMNSPIKSFQILKRSSSPCRLQNQKQAGGSIWGKGWESWASPLLVLWPRARPPRALWTSGLPAPSRGNHSTSPRGLPQQGLSLPQVATVMAEWMFSQWPWSRVSSACWNTGSLQGAWQMSCLRSGTSCHSKYFLHQSAGGWPSKPQHWLRAPLTWALFPLFSECLTSTTLASVLNSAASHVAHLQCLFPGRPSPYLPTDAICPRKKTANSSYRKYT